MEQGKIRVVQYGFGPIGQACVRAVLKRDSLLLTGVIDVDPEKVGKDIGEILKLGDRRGIKVRRDAAKVLEEAKPDVVLHTTQSFVPRVFDQISQCVEAGAHVISSTEELYWPHYRHPELAEKLDLLAQKHSVVILGTGVNPGFVMDTLPIALSSQCLEVRKIFATRVVDASKRRLPLQKKIGAGMTPEDFRTAVELGQLGHIGLVESLVAIADTLGWKLSRLDETIDPVIAEEQVKTPYLTVEAGQVAGIKHICRGYVDDEEVLTLDLRMYVGAKEPKDEIVIDGDPPVHAVLPGGIFGDTATVANLVNAIPRVLHATPGLRSVIDLGVPYAFLK